MASPAALAAIVALALAPAGARAATCCYSSATGGLASEGQVCYECEGEWERAASPPPAAAAIPPSPPPPPPRRRALLVGRAPNPRPPQHPLLGFPNWAIAVIVVVVVLAVAAVCTYFCVKHRRNYLKRHPSEVARNRVFSLRRKGLEATPSLAARAAGTKPEAEAGEEGGEAAAEKGEIKPSPSSAARPLGV